MKSRDVFDARELARARAAKRRLLADNHTVVHSIDPGTLLLRTAAQIQALDEAHHEQVGMEQPHAPNSQWRFQGTDRE